MTGALAGWSGLRILGLFSGSLGYLAVAAGTAGGTYFVTSRSYEVKIARLEQKQSDAIARDAQDALQKFVSDARIISDAALIFKEQQNGFQTKLAAINAAFDETARAAPLPPGCAPPASRMRSLADAIKAANSALPGARQQPGRAMPGTDTARGRGR